MIAFMPGPHWEALNEPIQGLFTQMLTTRRTAVKPYHLAQSAIPPAIGSVILSESCNRLWRNVKRRWCKSDMLLRKSAALLE
jgi:hypothetical protein